MRFEKPCAALAVLGVVAACGAFPSLADLSGSPSDASVIDSNATDSSKDSAVLTDASVDAGSADADASSKVHVITWRSTAVVSVPNGAMSLALARPVTVMAGDVLVATIAMGNTGSLSQPMFTAPAGWTLVRRLDNGNATTLAVYWHLAGSSEPSMYTWTFDLSIEGEGWLSDYAGVDPASPVDVEKGAVVVQSLSAYSAPALTTLSANDVVLGSFASHANVASNWTAPPATTTRASLNNGSTRAGLGVEQTFAMPGSVVGPWSATIDNPQEYALTHVLALRPAP